MSVVARYQARPVVVTAWQITYMHKPDKEGRILCLSGDRDVFHLATREQTARMTPCVGDYVVTQEDDYVYLNPQAVFERKYRAVDTSVSVEKCLSS